MRAGNPAAGRCGGVFAASQSSHPSFALASCLEGRDYMSKNIFDLRGIVLAWTLVTTTFMWTPTMRLLLKPEISHWKLFDAGGVGSVGAFWLLPLLAMAALLLFYVEGRGRCRPLFHFLLLAWHLPITAALVFGSVWGGTQATFQGAMWGVKLPFVWLAPPFALFAALAVLLVVRETRGSLPVPVRPWGRIQWRKLALAGLLLPVAFAFFRIGEGYDVMVMIATVVTVFQWILLAEALGGEQSASEQVSAQASVSS